MVNRSGGGAVSQACQNVAKRRENLMKLSEKMTFAAVIVCICMAATVMAKSHGSAMPDDEHTMMTMETTMKQACQIEGRVDTLQSADKIIGMDVHNRDNQPLGYIKDLLVDETTQAIHFVLVSPERQRYHIPWDDALYDDKYLELTIRDINYPIPWSAFETGTDTYVLDITKDELSRSPVISTMDNMKLRQFELYALSRVIGFNVKDQRRENLGFMEDAVFDVRGGNMAYALVNFGGLLGFGDKTAAVPWESVQLQTSQKIAKVNANRETLQTSVLPDKNLSMLTEPTFARQVHQGYNQEPYWEVFGFIEPGSGASAMTTDMAWHADSRYNKCFDMNTIQTMNVTVKKVGTFLPEINTTDGLKLQVETEDGQMMTVYAGPQQHYMQQSLRFQPGDRVTIKGSETTVNQMKVIMACEISRGNQRFEIRDMQGQPCWNMGVTPEHQMR